MSDIKTKLKKGLITIFITSYSRILFNILFTAILARILSPEDFGIIAIVTVFITFFQLLTHIGLGPAIVQKKLSEDEIATIFNIILIIAGIATIMFFFFSYFVAFFYNNKNYIHIVKLLSIMVFFETIKIVPYSLLRKRKLFIRLGIAEISGLIVSSSIAVVCGLLGLSYWALVYKAIINSIVVALLLLIISGFKFKLIFLKEAVKKVLKYSAFQFLSSLVNYVSRNIDNLLIGKVLGEKALGFYDKAYKLMLYPLNNLARVMTPVLHPVLSDYSEQKKVLYRTFLSITRFFTLIGVPLSVFMFFSAKEIILILFGPKWTAAVLPLKILSTIIWIQMIRSSFASIYQAADRTDILFISTLYSTIMNISGIVIGLFYDLAGVAAGLTISNYITILPSALILIKICLKMKVADFLKIFINPLLIGLVIFLVLYFESNFILFNIIIDILIKGITTIILFLLGIIITGEKSFIKKVIKSGS